MAAKQPYPWNGKVDITYVTGDIAAEAKQRAVFTSLKVTALDKTANKTYTAKKPGVYTVTVKATNASVTKATDATAATFKITVPNFECAAAAR